VNRDEVAEQLGDNFQDAFLNKETRSYDAISPTQMQVWLKLMGGSPVGTLSAEMNTLIELNTLKLTNPEAAWRTQTFYDTRDASFPDWYETQQGYYALPKAERRAYLNANPDLARYWDWRLDFMEKNPDIVPYMTDDEKALERARKTTRVPEVAVPTAQEIMGRFSPAMQALITDARQGEEIPPEMDKLMESFARLYRLTPEQMYGILGVGR
jgi:hypothetical protein